MRLGERFRFVHAKINSLLWNGSRNELANLVRVIKSGIERQWRNLPEVRRQCRWIQKPIVMEPNCTLKLYLEKVFGQVIIDHGPCRHNASDHVNKIRSLMGVTKQCSEGATIPRDLRDL